MPPPVSSEAFVREVHDQYAPRASTYDTANGGWHAQLGHDFVTWLPPPPGGAVLDLACGTGLVALPYAEALGPDGVVVGVDLTEAMLNEARSKPLPSDGAPVTWVRGDVMDLSSLEAVQDVVAARGGFDVISCCSALVLLQDPRAAVKHWTQYLKPSTGKVIIDIPTEDHTLQYLFSHPLRAALAAPFVFGHDWVEGVHSIRDIVAGAGLEVERSFRTRSYLPEKWYRADQGMEVFEEKTGRGALFDKVVRVGYEGAMQKARDAWPKIWAENLDADGRLWDGHRLYVAIGTRRG